MASIRILNSDSLSTIRKEDLIFFSENSSLLRDNNRKHGKTDSNRENFNRSVAKLEGVITGLVNEGATCYLNSVLQCLLQCQLFSDSILAADTDNGKSSIVSNLQALFARMLMSTQHAVRTDELLKSFGWAKDEVYQQHDAHELFSLLFSSLEDSISDKHVNSALLSFQGEEQTSLYCPLCGYSQKKVNKYNCLSVDVPVEKEANYDNNSSSSLADLLARLTAKEILDADNRWTCSGCQASVCAEKQLTYLNSEIPKHLCIQLKRFSFDRTTFRRLKVSSSVTFPLVLTIPYQSPNLDQVTEEEYELTGIVCHFGTALGGHYRAVVKCTKDTKNTAWFECDDESASPISEEELHLALTSTNPSISTGLGTGAEERKKHRLALLQENAYLLFYSRKESLVSSPSKDTIINELIPAHIKNKVHEENEKFKCIQRLDNIRQQFLELSVLFPSSLEHNLQHHERFYIPKDLSIHQLRDLLIQEWFSQKSSGETDTSFSLSEYLSRIDLARLRRVFHPNLSSKAHTYKGNEETFFGRDHSTLGTLKFQESETLVLDIRKTESDPLFIEFHPKDLVLDVQVLRNVTESVLNDETIDQGIGEPFDRESGWASLLVSAVSRIPSTDEMTDRPTLYQLHRSLHQQFPFLSSTSYYLCTFPTPSTSNKGTIRKYFSTQKESDTLSAFLPHSFYDGTKSDGGTMEMIHYFLSPSSPAASSATIIEDVSHSSGKDEVLEDKHTTFYLQDHDRLVIIPVETGLSTMLEEKLLTYIEKLRSKITIYFNHPFIEDIEGDPYIHHLDVSSDETLVSLRTRFQQYLKLSSQTEQSFHFRKSATGSQLKDETKTLLECDIGQHGLIHLQAGSGCKVGEVLLRLELQIPSINANAAEGDSAMQIESSDISSTSTTTAVDAKKKANSTWSSPFVFITDYPVAEKATILQIKQQIFAQWHSLHSQVVLQEATLVPKDPHHIRLKDLAKQPPITLRDDRVLQRCLLNLSDGRRLGMQILPYPEVLTAEDMLVTVKIASFDAKRLITVEDAVAVSRTWHTGQLYRHLVKVFPQLCEKENVEEPITVASNSAKSSKENKKATQEFRSQHTSGDSSRSSCNGSDEEDDDDDDDGPCAPDSQLIDDESQDLGSKKERTVQSMFPQQESDLFFDIAKAFTTGPPLTLKTALKLKWNECFPFISGASITDLEYEKCPTIDKPPLTLRDGSILVLRGHADFARAQARVKSTKEQQELQAQEEEKMRTEAEDMANETGVVNMDDQQPIVAGKGLSVVRARKAQEASQQAGIRPWLTRNKPTGTASTTTNTKGTSSSSASVMAMRNKVSHAAASTYRPAIREPKMRIARESDNVFVPEQQEEEADTSLQDGEYENVVVASKDSVKARGANEMINSSSIPPLPRSPPKAELEPSIGHPRQHAPAKEMDDNVEEDKHELLPPFHPMPRVTDASTGSIRSVSGAQVPTPLVGLKSKSKSSLAADEPPPSPIRVPHFEEERSRPPPL